MAEHDRFRESLCQRGMRVSRFVNIREQYGEMREENALIPLSQEVLAEIINYQLSVLHANGELE